MLGRRLERRRARCEHRETVSVKTAGIERVVCEACGHVSVRFLSDMDGQVERESFARPSEREAEAGRHRAG